MNDVSLNTACPQPTRQPEAITSGLISDNDALDLAPGLTGFIAPTMQELTQTRMCRFPASGSSRKSFARSCVPMDDPGCWQWVTREEIIQSISVDA